MAVGILITADEVKELNSISGSTDYDYQITAMIPIVTDFIYNYCNFDDTTYTYDTYDWTEVGLKLPAAQLILWQIKQPDHNIKQEKVGNYAVSFGETIPKAILNGLNPYRKMRYY